MALREVDFSQIGREYQGFWIMIRLGDEQEILAQAESALEAIRLTKLLGINPNDPTVVLTQVPEVPTAARMADPGEL